ncbi:MAG: MotA/TolQ/ExbB proton channel [Firmicutes bacterium]|nr:MotA/TolQ/ExbB proton channel [Bacillota bacterium]
MYILLLCSLSVVAIAIDRFMYYLRAEAKKDKFQTELSEILLEKNNQEAIGFCKKFSSASSFLALEALKARERGTDIELALESAYSLAATRLRSNLNYLSAIVTLAPLLGLLGTISGMMESFSIFSLDSNQPLAITGGIGEALIATATGLCVAVLALVVHTYYAQRLDTILTDLEQVHTVILVNLKKAVAGGNANETA